MIIDIFSHHISMSAARLIERGDYYGEGKSLTYPPQNADPEVRLGLMEKYGIDMQALSQSTPVLLGFSPGDAAEICRVSNEDNYSLCKAYPRKFVNICMVSLLDTKSAMQELDHCFNDLDCRGVTLSTNQNGKGLDSPEYFPFYEQVVQHDVPIFLHPTHWESYPLVDMDKGWRMMMVFGWPFDTTQAVWRLIMGGIIDRFPSLKIITHHLGAMLPYFARRVEQNFNRFFGNAMPRPFAEYWKNFYGDTAVDGTVAAYACGYAFFGPERTVFGTDYPFGGEGGEDLIRTNLEGVRGMRIPAEDMKKILGENAKELLKI